MRLRGPRLANRWRLTLRVLAAVLVVAGIAGVVSVRAVEAKFRGELDDDLRSQARGIALASEVIGLERLEDITEQPGFGANDLAIVVVGAEGPEVTVASGPVDDPDPLPAVADVPLSDLRARAGEPFEVDAVDGSLRYRALATQLDDGRMALVAVPLTGLEAAVRTVVQVLLVASLVAGLVLSVTIALVSGHVTRPLDAMIDTAEAVAAGDAVRSADLRARVATEGVEDVARLGRALNEMLERLERAFADREASEEVLRRFVADASHELRTPLAAILGYTELHREGMAPRPEQVDRAMARIAAEGERMRQLVDELLLLARLDERRPLEREPVDLGLLAAEAVADARAVAPDQDLSLAPASGLVVRGDALSLRQAVDNLLGNARVHAPGAAVAVRVGRDGDDVVVEVADEGPGLTPEEAARAFDRFFRADRSRARPGGAGLGLSIVAAVAEAHGGTATVAPTPGGGSTFAIRLPAASGP